MKAVQRLAVISLVLMALMLIISSPGLAQITPDAVVAGFDEGVYVQRGAGSVDAGRLATVRSAAADEGIDLYVVVLADSVDAQAFATGVKERTGGTILVFTPDAYGASSSEFSQQRMDDALDEAADELGSDDVVAGVSAFVSAATPTSRPWGLIITASLLLLVVVAVVGRILERRATAGRRTAALAKAWAGLQQRADAMSDPVIELSTPVEIVDRPDITERYRAAASRYGELAGELGRTPDASRVDAIDGDLGELERELDALRSELRPGS